MPQATLSLRRLQEMLPHPLTRAELTERLWMSKAELDEGEGDELHVVCTADRLDLLTEGGLGLYLQGVFGAAVGLPPIRPVTPAPSLRLRVDESVLPLRPAIAGLVVAPPEGTTLDAGLLEEAIRFQELLHATFGLERRLASLGIYPIARIHAPVHYRMEALAGVRFTPLGGTAPVEGRTFFEEDPMAVRYGKLGRVGEACLTLRDDAGTILSLPPVLNSREAGEAQPGDGALLLESTGTRGSRVDDALGLLSMVFVARGWRVTAVPVEEPGGLVERHRLARARPIDLPKPVLAGLAGRSMPEDEVEMLLQRSRMGVQRTPTGWRVEVPPWRPDLQTATDVAEDVLLARGIRAEDGLLSPSSTRGRRTEVAKFRARVGDLFLGLGLVPLYTPVLVPARVVELVGRTETIGLSNPVSDQFAFLRDSLVLSLVGTLERNTRRSYPQRFSEVGPVVVPSPGGESGSETRYHAGAFLAGDGEGFSDAAALVDYVIRTLGTAGVREPVEIPGTIPGRSANVRLAGEVVAQIGELHPALLAKLGVPVPVAWAELDLTALAPLIGLRPPQ
ncbi:MAG: hypothetical protein L3J86_03705 [Thermoplasmata archaeon]|nr:hypothetical protein [Thermoplasmata archaeon]